MHLRVYQVSNSHADNTSMTARTNGTAGDQSLKGLLTRQDGSTLTGVDLEAVLIRESDGMVHGMNCNQEFAHLLDQQPAMQNQYHTVSFRLFSGCFFKLFLVLLLASFRGRGWRGLSLLKD